MDAAVDAKQSQDLAIHEAVAAVERIRRGDVPAPIIETFFDEATFTASHVVHDPLTKAAAIVDSVLDFDQASGRTSFKSAGAIVEYVEKEGLNVEWLLETHAHADHLSAAPYLHQCLGGKIAIGEHIRAVQQVFGEIFNEGTEFARDGSQFDRLFSDGDSFELGSMRGIALHVPGHTPADIAYVIGDAAFVGDTMFMPDYGTARCDFPGGDPRQLYKSIRRLMELPGETRLFLCHDYKAPPNRLEFAWQTTIEAQRAANVHVHQAVTEDEFVTLRTARDKTLSTPRLLLPSVQVNMRAGHFPDPEANGTPYLKLPLNLL